MTPSPRRIAGALDVLLALPPAVLQVLAERIVDRLDALDGDPDAEPDDDGEADHDGEAAPWAPDEHHWPPVNGPAECCAVRLGWAGAARLAWCWPGQNKGSNDD